MTAEIPGAIPYVTDEGPEALQEYIVKDLAKAMEDKNHPAHYRRLDEQTLEALELVGCFHPTWTSLHVSQPD